MAFETTRQEITKQANDLLKLFRQTRNQKYKDEELRLRRIVGELESFVGGGGVNQIIAGTNITISPAGGTGNVTINATGGASTPTLAQVTTAGNTTTNTIDVGGILTDYVRLDTAATPTPVVGMMSWDSDRSTVSVQLDSDVDAHLGQDNFWYVKNQSGSTIPKGKAVMAVGTLGTSGRILIDEMVADGSVSPKYLIGITAEDIANGADGFVMNIGKIRQLDTSVWTAGSVLYCDPSTPGNLTSTKPSSPNLALPIAFVVHSAANGTIAVRIQTIDENASGGSTPTLAQVTTAGNTTTNSITVGKVTTNGSITATAALAQGSYFNNTLIAAANNDVLVGLDINPTFTNGAFIGLDNQSLRVTGTSVSATGDSNGIGAAIATFRNNIVTSGFNPAYIVKFNRQNSAVAAWYFGNDANNNGVIVTNNSSLRIGRDFAGTFTEYQRIFAATGNIVIQNGGTYTDAGYKLDVNGTARIQGALTATLSNATTANVIYYNTSTGLFTYGVAGGGGSTPTLDQVTTAGNTTTNAITVGRLTTNQSVTASSAIARGVFFNNTLVAAANDDVLVGLDIIPTFTNGAFTGLDNQSLRVTGTSVSATGDANGVGAAIATFRNNRTSTTFDPVYIVKFTRQNSAVAAWYFGNDANNNGVIVTNNSSLRIGRDFGGTFTEYQRIFGATGNILIQNGGTYTDAGYKLDVNGTARIQGALRATLASATTANVIYYDTSTGLFTYGAAGGGGSTPTLQQVTTAGNITTNAVRVEIASGDGLFLKAATSGVSYPLIMAADSAGRGFVIGSSALTFTSRATYGVQFNVRSNYSEIQAYTNISIGTPYPFIINPTGGDVLIGTTTISGYKLDVNGTARIQSTLNVIGNASIGSTAIAANTSFQVNGGTTKYVNYNGYYSSGSFFTYQAFGSWEAYGADAATATILAIGGYRSSQWAGITFHSSGAERARITSSGNVLIGTTTDAGYKLDVNGTIRSSGVITATGGNSTNWNTAYGWGNHATAGYLVSAPGYTGIVTFPTNPPGQQNLDFLNGVLVNVF